MPRNRGNLVQSMLSFDTYSSKVKSDFLNAKSKLSSAMSKINSIEKERKVARKQLPIPVQALQFTLSFFNFILFCIYVMLFGFTVSSILMVLNEDCLKVAPSYNFLPERVPPNTVRGYECTGIRLIEKNDYFQILLLVLLTVAIGIQMISCDLAFTGAVTLTVRNIKLSIWLFASSALLLIIFILFDFPLKLGRQYLRYMGAYNKGFLSFMLLIALSHVFIGFFSIILLLQWNRFISVLNKMKK